MRVNKKDIRRTVLEVIKEQADTRDRSLHSTTILQEAARRLDIRGDLEAQQALLTFLHDLFRTGYLAWGHDLQNPSPTFCHLTDRCRRALAHLTRDPANPEGYFLYLAEKASLNEVAWSYIREALATFNAGCYKAAAVLLGAAAKSMVVSLRDTLEAKIEALSHEKPIDLSDWRIKRVLNTIKEVFKSKKKVMPRELYQSFEHNWQALTHQIRTARNAAGHAESIDPVTEEEVHAALWLFPVLASLVSSLDDWVKTDYS